MTVPPRDRDPAPGDRPRLLELLAALSVATDLGMGQPAETALRSSVLAMGLARALELPDDDVRTAGVGTLLRHIGCTVTAAAEARLYGDELESRRAAQPADFGDRREMLALALASGRGSGAGRPWRVARAIVGGRRHGRDIVLSVCDAASVLASRLRLGPRVEATLSQQFERWDGTGPLGLAREDIPLPARVMEVATQAVLFAPRGPDAVCDMVRERAGTWFDPDVADVFRRTGRLLLRDVESTDPWRAILDREPGPVAYIAEADLDRIARCFADLVDVKSPYTHGHSVEVAALAESAARILQLPENEVIALRRAALLHDLGRVAISSAIWEKPGALTRGEWELVRLHPYHTERILSGSSVLDPLARIAGLHHERLDGSGYPHRLLAEAIPLPTRVLAAADCFQAATQDRPHRASLTIEAAAELVTSEARAGRLDADCVAAVVRASGQRPPRLRRDWPAGLSDREVDVLRLLCRGLTNAQIATQLVISRRTAEHHVQHIYAKIGHSTRAAATLFALEHDLVSR